MNTVADETLNALNAPKSDRITPMPPDKPLKDSPEVAIDSARMNAGSQFELLLTACEAAKLLRLHEKTLQSHARAGTVPAIRLGKSWRFRASALDAWIRGKLQSLEQSRRES